MKLFFFHLKMMIRTSLFLFCFFFALLFGQFEAYYKPNEDEERFIFDTLDSTAYHCDENEKTACECYGVSCYDSDRFYMFASLPFSCIIDELF